MVEAHILLPSMNAIDKLQKLIPELHRAGVPHRLWILEDSNLPRCGVPWARNTLMRWALKDPECKYMVHLSNDIDTITPGWLAETIETFKGDPKIGAVSLGKMVNYGTGFGNFIHGDFIPETDERWAFSEEDHVQVVTSLCVITRKAIETVGRFDENFGMGGYEEIDMALRMWQAGFRVVLSGMPRYHHDIGPTGNHFDYPMLNSDYFAKKWGPGSIDVLTQKVRTGTLKSTVMETSVYYDNKVDWKQI
jgi:O-antigen biosynthesis protein